MALGRTPSGGASSGALPIGGIRHASFSGFSHPLHWTKYVSSGAFVAPKTGWYRILTVGGGGAGGAGLNTGVAVDHGCGAGSGYVAFGIVRLFAGEEVQVVVGGGAVGSLQSRDINHGGATSFGVHLKSGGGQGGSQETLAGVMQRAGSGFSGGGQLGDGTTDGAVGGVNGADGGHASAFPPPAGGQGEGAFDAVFAQFVHWSIRGAVAPEHLGAYDYQGGNGVQVDDDTVLAGNGDRGASPGGASKGGTGYGAGGGGGARYLGVNGVGGIGADGLCLVEGPILTG